MFSNAFKISFFIFLFIFSTIAPRLEAAETCASNTSSADHSHYSSNTLIAVQNLALSIAGFFGINMVLYRTDWYANQVGTTLSVFGISCVDVLLNLNNYLVTENSAYGNNIFLLPAIIVVFMLEEFRYSMQRKPAAIPPMKTRLLTAIAHVFKNKLNFVVTENWFPREWSKPPEVDAHSA